MKRSIFFILTTVCLCTIAGNVAAQNAAPDGKPMKATIKKEQEVNTALAAPKLQTANELQAAKPIVPGGEFKPADTRTASSDRNNASPLAPKIPVMPATTTPAKKEEKKTSPVKVQQQ